MSKAKAGKTIYKNVNGRLCPATMGGYSIEPPQKLDGNGVEWVRPVSVSLIFDIAADGTNWAIEHGERYDWEYAVKSNNSGGCEVVATNEFRGTIKGIMEVDIAEIIKCDKEAAEKLLASLDKGA
jgi:hypothetical protein